MWLKEQVLDAVRLKGIQETIAGFLNDQVLNPGDECYFNHQEPMKPVCCKYFVREAYV